MKDDKIVLEAKKRFKRCQDSESDNRRLFIDDLRFANGDSDNMYQWPEEQARSRKEQGKPCITVNKVKQHNRQITNEARQNKPAVRVLPVDGGADIETADIMNGIIRHIESQSSADTAYDTAAEFAVDAGIGYWRITTDYASDDSFDQEIYIKRVKNPLNVYLGPHDEADGSDVKYGFIFEDMPNEDYESMGYGKPSSSSDFDGEWNSDDTTRIAEYFRVVERPEELEVEGRKRTVNKRTVEWYLINSEKVLEKREWLGKYIPIVRVVGSETEIDGKTVRTGHTRQVKDPQRIYNYWSSSTVEFVALQAKQPYVSPAEALIGYEDKWAALNTSNDPVLPYNHIDDNGEPIPRPERQQPPVMAQAYIQGMQIASDEMKAASGQYDAQFGENANAQSGRALNTLQRKGDNATFHFIDNVARAVKYTGTILVDLIPKIYDTARVVRILGEDGKEDEVSIDPNQEQSVKKQYSHEKGEIKKIYNPSVGRYDVTVTVGANFGTRRQEAADAMSQMLQQTPQLMQIAGDLIMRMYDFPYAEELAERIARTIPPELMKSKEDDEQDQQQPSPELQQKDQLIQQMDQLIQKLHAELNAKAVEDQKAQMGLQLEQEKIRIDQFNAETNRLKTQPKQQPPDPVEMAKLEIEQMRLQIEQDKLRIEQFNAETNRIKVQNEAMMQSNDQQISIIAP